MASIQTELTDIALETALAVSGERIRYERETAAIVFDAIPGASEWDEDMGGPAIVAAKSQDWIFRASNIASLGKPEPGDLVKQETCDGETLVFTVMAPTGQQPWRFSDRGRRWIRLHTKQTGTE